MKPFSLAAVQEYEQLSLFSIYEKTVVAVSCFNGDQYSADHVDPWMKKLVPKGVYVISVGHHPCVLQPARITCTEIPDGHHFFHYAIGEEIFSGVFVG